MSSDKHEYEVNLKWREGRVGTLSSPVLQDKVEVATPPQFPGGVEGIWSPEHLLVSSVSSCFMTTFVAIAEYSGLDFECLDVRAVGKLEKVEGKFMVSEITLQPHLLVSDENKSGKALRIIEKTEAACLISRSLKTKIGLEPTVSTGVLN